MHITLSQKEITAAVRAYVANRGIGVGFSLSDVKFAATRNPAGISAELTLEETTSVEIPGFTDRPADTATVHTLEAPKASTVAALITNSAENIIQTSAETLVAAANSITPVEEVKSVPEEVAAAIDAGVAEVPVPADEPAPAAEEAVVAPVNTTSLFG